MKLDSKEHIFRGMTESGTWAYGAYLKHRKINYCIAAEAPDDNIEHLILREGMADWNLPIPITAVAVSGDSIGEYIGINDCDDKKIFTGDIVKFNGVRCRVVYFDGCFTLMTDDYIMRDNLYLPLHDEWVGCGAEVAIPFNELMWNLNESGSQYWLDEVKVVGNKMDNPDEWNKI